MPTHVHVFIKAVFVSSLNLNHELTMHSKWEVHFCVGEYPSFKMNYFWYRKVLRLLCLVTWPSLSIFPT